MADTKHIAKIITERDGISLEEAQELVEQTVDEIDYILATTGDYSDVEDIIASNLGLEMDYIFDLIP